MSSNSNPSKSGFNKLFVEETLEVQGGSTFHAISVEPLSTLQGAKMGLDGAFAGVLRLYNNLTNGNIQIVAANGNVQVFAGGSNTLTVTDEAIVNSGVMRDSVASQSGPGALPITKGIVELTTTGVDDALTLVDGVAGQNLTIVMVADGGNGIVTPTNLAGATSITFSDVGDSVKLVFVGSNWNIVSSNGVTIS